jgi:hypothetical protein
MAKTAKKQRIHGRPFRPGQSGNPCGPPKGALGKRTLLMRALEASDPVDLLEEQDAVSEALIRYYGSNRKVFLMKDIQLGARLIVSISDQMCAIAEIVRFNESHEARLRNAE